MSPKVARRGMLAALSGVEGGQLARAERFRDFWAVIAGSMVPMVVLGAWRSLLVGRALGDPLLGDAAFRQCWLVGQDDAEFWTGWAAGWVLGLAILPGRRLWRTLFFGATALLFVLELLDLGFVQVTGSRGDWDAIGELWRAPAQVWPVVRAEVGFPHFAALLAATLFTIGVARWRPVAPRRLVVAIGMLLLVAPSMKHQVLGRQRPRGLVQPLQPHVLEYLWFDAEDHRNDIEIAPDPATLVPTTVAAGPNFHPFNIVLILLESTGASRTSLYNPTLTTTPNLQRLAAEGLAFRKFFAVVPHTSKALIATLCGRSPRLDTEVTEARPGGLPGTCLPEILGRLGYRTAFFQTARGDFEDRFRLVRSMRYGLFRSRDTLPAEGLAAVNYFGWEDEAMRVPGLEWSADGDAPFFATYLTLTTHHDYDPPPSWPSRPQTNKKGKTIDGAEGRYLDSLAYVDDFVGRLVDGYRERGLADDTLFVIVGDHGEGFGEHGRFQHDLVIFEEGLQVPAVMIGPGVLGGRKGWVEGNGWHPDILPTILSLMGVEIEGEPFSGVDLLGKKVDALRTMVHSCWRSFRCIARREGDVKIIDFYRDGGGRRFELSTDPGEEKGKGVGPKETALAREERARINGRHRVLQEQVISRLHAPDDRPAVAGWGAVSLLGCEEFPATVMAGDGIWVDCRWREEQKSERAWALLFRVGGVLRMSEAGVLGKPKTDPWRPLDGLYPTWKWQVGEGVSDEVWLPVPRDLPVGPARVEVAVSSIEGEPVGGEEAWFSLGTVTVTPGVAGPAAENQEIPEAGD